MIKYTEQERVSIDYAKALGIILVVIGHFNNLASDIFRPYIYHMPLFFFIGGMVFRPKNLYDIVKNTVIKYFTYLVFCYVITGFIALLLNHYFGTLARNPFGSSILETIQIIKDNKFNNNPLFIFGWFLLCYPLVILISNIYHKIFIKNVSVIVFIAIPSLASFFAMNYLSKEALSTQSFSLNILCQIIVGSFFYLLGSIIKEKIFKLNNISILLFLLLTFFTLSNMRIISEMGMSFSRYRYGFIVHTIGAMLGIAIVFSISSILSSSTYSKTLGLIGGKSKDIMTFHMLSFTMIDIFFIIFNVYKQPEAPAITSHFQDNYTFPIYLFGSIIISILIGYVIKKITFSYIT